jgi:type IV pilus assembly protein PilW
MKLTHLHSSTHTAFENRGFTLVELMVAVAISGIVAAAISTAYISQRRSSTAQEQVVEMQQNIRAGLGIMEHDIRMAGYDPKNSTPTPTITTATATQLLFTMLVADPPDTFNNDNDNTTDEGDEIETFGYRVYDSTPVGDGFTALGRQHKALFVAVAENIDAIEFYYTLSNGTQITSPTAAQLDDIRAVQISLLARAGRADQDFTNTMTYTPASGSAAWDINGASAGTGNPPNDNFRRRLHITTIQCRNMGL